MFSIQVSEAELAVVALALGRMLSPRAVPVKKASAVKRPAAYRSKPPKLSAGQFLKVTERWEAAVADPEKWRIHLQNMAAGSTGRHGTDIEKAWGIVA